MIGDRNMICFMRDFSGPGQKRNSPQSSCSNPRKPLNALSAERTFFRPSHFWWSKECNQKNLTVIWDRYIRKLNAQLSFVDEHGEPMKFHSHMLRDTFAVEMLLAGVSLEDVSRLLTHSSIRTTERYYAHWVKARRDQLEQKTIDAMRRMGATVTAN